MHAEHGSPERVYADFAAAAHGAVANVKTFTTLMRDGASEEIRQRARASEAASHEGIEDWLFTQHPDWFDKPVPVMTKMKPPKENDAKGKASKKVGEGVEEDVKAFGEAYPDVRLTLKAPEKTIELRTPPPAKMAFTISWAEQAKPDRPVYAVTCEQGTKMGRDVARVLARRPHAGNLRWTLVRPKQPKRFHSMP